jgi:Protein of unknown function (DUF2484)
MMSLPLILGCLWVVAATVTAMLPMRRQMIPGVGLLVSAPALLIWIGIAHGWLWVGFGLFAFGSMFRKPLFYLARRLTGQAVEPPPEFRK